MISFTLNGEPFQHDAADLQVILAQNWQINRAGYLCSTGHTRKCLHQILMGEAPPTYSVDHVNGDRLDCRRQNLRWATRTQQAINRKVSDVNVASCKGVQRYRRTGWTAKITVLGKIIYLGFFAKMEDAVAARKAAELKYHQPLMEKFYEC